MRLIRLDRDSFRTRFHHALDLIAGLLLPDSPDCDRSDERCGQRHSPITLTAVRPGATEQQKYRNGFEIDDHLSVRSPLLLNDRTSEACCSFAS